jgi:hypothetical protein
MFGVLPKNCSIQIHLIQRHFDQISGRDSFRNLLKLILIAFGGGAYHEDFPAKKIRPKGEAVHLRPCLDRAEDRASSAVPHLHERERCVTKGYSVYQEGNVQHMYSLYNCMYPSSGE